ncbi:MAG: hypothetical protein QM648_00690 [Solirubrobacterales bacterium]
MKPQIESLLQPGEKILWSGSPSEDRLLMRIDYWLIPAGILSFIIGFVLVATGISFALKDDWQWMPRVCFGIALLGISWDLVIGHLMRRRREAGRAAYAVTDRRAIAAQLTKSSELRWQHAEFRATPELTVHPQYEGRATIDLGSVQLFNIEGAERVESLIRQQLPADA